MGKIINALANVNRFNLILKCYQNLFRHLDKVQKNIFEMDVSVYVYIYIYAPVTNFF